jgi:hypothetical protein
MYVEAKFEIFEVRIEIQTLTQFSDYSCFKVGRDLPRNNFSLRKSFTGTFVTQEIKFFAYRRNLAGKFFD